MSPAESAATVTTLCLGVGRAAKGIDAIPDKFIPVILGAVGAVAQPLLCGLTGEAVVVGLVSGLAAVGVNQQWRQATRPPDQQPPQPPTP